MVEIQPFWYVCLRRAIQRRCDCYVAPYIPRQLSQTLVVSFRAPDDGANANENTCPKSLFLDLKAA